MDHTTPTVTDPRVLEYPLMTSPFTVLAILTLYFLIVYRWGPAYMAERKPFNIKWILALYNLFQVLACAFLVQRVSHRVSIEPENCLEK